MGTRSTGSNNDNHYRQRKSPLTNTTATTKPQQQQNQKEQRVKRKSKSFLFFFIYLFSLLVVIQFFFLVIPYYHNNQSYEAVITNNNSNSNKIRGDGATKAITSATTSSTTVKSVDTTRASIIGSSSRRNNITRDKLPSLRPPTPTLLTQEQMDQLEIIPIDELTMSESSSSNAKCPEGLVYIDNRHYHNTNNNNNMVSSMHFGSHKINTDSSNRVPPPLLVHQTSKSRCVTKRFADIIEHWQNFANNDNSNDNISLSYYFHDDNAILRLLQQDYPEFPMLQTIVDTCLRHSGGTMKADLWRYLVLYVYGGVYADIDTKPKPNLYLSLIKHMASNDNDDGSGMDSFFLMEQFHLLSQYFMVVLRPRHPLMYYAIQYSLKNLYHHKDIRKMNAALLTGPHALHEAYRRYRKDYGNVIIDSIFPGKKPVRNGTYTGTNGYTITIVGYAENENEYINREVLRLGTKKKQYALMNMTSFHDDYKNVKATTEKPVSCLQAIQQNHLFAN